MSLPTVPRLVLVAACLPLALAGCSGSSSSSAPSATSSVAPSSPAPTASRPPGLAIAKAYVVTVGKGVSDKDLSKALTPLAKLPGVTGVSLIGHHQLRVDLASAKLADKGAALFGVLTRLGTISVPKK